MKDYKQFVSALYESEPKQGKVETHKYSWGTMKTVHHGHDFSIPLHPEHHHAISKLKDEQEHKFKDETGRHWVARRKGEHVHFDTTGNGSLKTHVPMHTMHEEYMVDELDEETHAELARQAASKYRSALARGDSVAASAASAERFRHKKAAAQERQKSHVPGVQEEVMQESDHDPWHDAQENKKSADSAKKQGDHKAYHMHMADHHENMAQWSMNRGRHAVANQHQMKADQHHDWAHGVKEEVELEESMVDSWKKVQSMDKGSLTGGKEQARKRLDYLTAVHAHHKKFGNDTKKVKSEIEDLNRSKLAEDLELNEAKVTDLDDYFSKIEMKGGEPKKAAPKKEPENTISGSQIKFFTNFREETELSEKMNLAKADMGDVIKDFQKSDAPQFAGKSKEKKQQMAIAAKLEADRKQQNEGVIQPTGDDTVNTGADNKGKTTYTKDKSGKLVSFKYEGEWKKATKKDPRGKVTHMSDVAQRQAAKMANEEVEIDEATKYVVHYHNEKGEHVNSSKAFDDKAKAQAHADKGNKVDKVGGKYSVKAMQNEEVEQVEEQAPVAPVPDRKYIKGTPEWKAHKEKSKPRTGHPTNQKEEFSIDDEGNFVIENKLTYEEFMSQLLEYTPGPGGVTRVQGRSYGAQYHDPEGDDDADDKPAKKAEPTAKRGRGRPAGSKSGANVKRLSSKGSNGYGYDSTGYKLHLPNSNK